jgi:hypothetical protein
MMFQKGDILVYHGNLQISKKGLLGEIVRIEECNGYSCYVVLTLENEPKFNKWFDHEVAPIPFVYDGEYPEYFFSYGI